LVAFLPAHLVRRQVKSGQQLGCREIEPSIGDIGGDALYDFDGLARIESPSGNPLAEAISAIHVKDQDPDAALLQVVVIVRVVILDSRKRRVQRVTHSGPSLSSEQGSDDQGPPPRVGAATTARNQNSTHLPGEPDARNLYFLPERLASSDGSIADSSVFPFREETGSSGPSCEAWLPSTRPGETVRVRSRSVTVLCFP
jgi:hypothetical protein